MTNSTKIQTTSQDGVGKMELLLNDLSLHGQFSNIQEFREVMRRVMQLRKVANEQKCQLYVRRDVLNRPAIVGESMYNALQKLSRDEKRAILGWVDKNGPFWVVSQNPDLWLCHGDEIVTGTAVGEAAHYIMQGEDRRLVSFTPSSWEYSPVQVFMGPDANVTVGAVPNYWQCAELKTALQQAEPPIRSWTELEFLAHSRFRSLTFSSDCFADLNKRPFAPSTNERIICLLDILNRLMEETDAAGRRTAAGHQLYQNFFHGDRARFSDSSDTEKRDFQRQLEFRHPGKSGHYLSCTWHGKVNTPPYRIHFAWPEQPGDPLYVTYIGRKITI